MFPPQVFSDLLHIFLDSSYCIAPIYGMYFFSPGLVSVYQFKILQLICTVTPASSNIEETHNTLKFASRAKRVEIYASRNRVKYLR